MNMQWVDWTIVFGFIAILSAVAVYAKRFNKGVADFLAANRCAGRYLLCVSNSMAAIGAISFAAQFQQYYAAGFSAIWWIMMLYPIYLLFAISGWITYRYRETRVLTMAQFFEIRYSRKFRIFAGILAWGSGVLNMGIFPAVTARLFIHVCGLPESYSLFGIEGISTFVSIMLFELSIALAFTFLGGMIAVMVTDFLQGILTFVTLSVIGVFLMMKFDWGVVIETLQAAPVGASMLNPFNTTRAEGFNLAYFMMYAFLVIYNFRAWQGNQGYSAAARSAHEQKMAGIIGQWRGMVQIILLLIIPIAAYTLMNHAGYASQAGEVQAILDGIANPAEQKQMLVPIALTKMLPVGLLGLFVTTLFAAAVSTDDTYLHSWGSIFVQDVILPFRKNGFTPEQHTRILRASIFFVALLIFGFSLLFKQNDFIMMYMYMTGAIYLGGAGAVIIGGFYWKRATSAAAWGVMCTGSILGVGGLIVRSVWSKLVPALLNHFPHNDYLIRHAEAFPYNGMHIAFFTAIFSIIVFVLVSLFGWLVQRKPAFNMDRMLHRGSYAIRNEFEEKIALPPTGLRTLIPSKEFTKLDRVLYFGLTGWMLVFFGTFVIVTIYHFAVGTTDAFWISFWSMWTKLTIFLSVATTIWLAAGGAIDMKHLFYTLKTAKRNVMDDGRVSGHHSLEDEVLGKDNPGLLDELRKDKEESKAERLK